MTERPEDREERRRTGPLGESEETRRETGPETDEGATRQIPSEQARREEAAEQETRLDAGETRRTRYAGEEGAEAEEKETRVIRTPGAEGTREAAYPRGYFEAAEEREDRLRDMYGGVDWLASFLGFVFAAVAGSIFAALAGLILGPLGFALNPGSGGLGAGAITGLVLVAILIFLTYLFGGYVSGRLARFDGGRNGMMSVVWSVVIGLLLLAVGSFLPGGLFQLIESFVRQTVMPAFRGLLDLGLPGLGIVVAGLLVALLGGFLGGRLGSRYHTTIDRTT